MDLFRSCNSIRSHPASHQFIAYCGTTQHTSVRNSMRIPTTERSKSGIEITSFFLFLGWSTVLAKLRLSAQIFSSIKHQQLNFNFRNPQFRLESLEGWVKKLYKFQIDWNRGSNEPLYDAHRLITLIHQHFMRKICY